MSAMTVISTTTDLFPILVDVEGGKAVDAVAAAEFSVRVAVGRAVHVADSHLGVVCRRVSLDRFLDL